LYAGNILEELSGVDMGTGTRTNSKVNIENVQLHSAYVGLKNNPTTAAWNVPRCAVYYFLALT